MKIIFTNTYKKIYISYAKNCANSLYMIKLYSPLERLKNFVLTAFLVVFSTNLSSAQEVEKHLIYYSNEINMGNYIGYGVDINYIYNEKYSAKFGVVGNIRRSTNEPSDYRTGFLGFLVGPYETVGSVNLQVGKIYYLNSKRNTRLNAAVGIGYSTVQLVENWESDYGGSFDSNYSYDIVRTDVGSLIISPKLEFPLGRIFGFTISPTAVINNKSSYYGIGLGYMVGLIRSKPVRK